MQPVLQVRSITFIRKRLARERKVVLSGVSLEVRQGEIYCLLGPSGSGKTTLLRIIAGLVPPTSGTVSIQGKDQTRIPAHSRDIGFVFQDPGALLPHLTVFENVAFPLRVGRLPEEKARHNELVNQALDAVRLTGLAKRKPTPLSGGEKQRVALARALVYQPSLLLLDEPLASLDNISKDHLLSHISEIRRRFDTTCLYVTHDEREAFRLADRIGVLDAGVLRQNSNANDMLLNPATATIARLTAAWNLLTVEHHAPTKMLRLPSGSTPAQLELLPDEGDGDGLFVAFPIQATGILVNAPPPEERFLTFPGQIRAVFPHDDQQRVLVKVGADLLKVPWRGPDSPPRPDTDVFCRVAKSALRKLRD